MTTEQAYQEYNELMANLNCPYDDAQIEAEAWHQEQRRAHLQRISDLEQEYREVQSLAETMGVSFQQAVEFLKADIARQPDLF